MALGWVSLKGDDHKDAPSLPDDFQDVDKWSTIITKLYQHRLRADYDNWSTTNGEFVLAPRQCLEQASRFLFESTAYLKRKYGLKI